MIVEFGSGNERPVYENGCTFDSSPLLDGKGELYGATLKIAINFRLIYKTGESLDDQIADLESFWQGTQDSFRLLNDEGQPTAHSYGSGTDKPLYGGVRVVKPPSYLRYQNGEYVSYRTGTVELEAVLRIGEYDPNQVLEFSESIEFEGGGAVFGHLQPNEGFPVKQRLRTNNLWRGTQSGRIVHLGRYGAIPKPIWPGAVTGRPKMRGESPRRIGNFSIGYPTSYSYSFESATPLNGQPNEWFN